MILEFQGKEYDTETWHGKVLKVLLSKKLQEIEDELILLQAKRDLSYSRRICELFEERSTIRYKLDLYEGKAF